MPIPSLYFSGDGTRRWSITRAAAYGAGIGALAALFKTFGPLHEVGSISGRILEIGGVALAFALLCAAAAALRNFLVRRFIWRE